MRMAIAEAQADLAITEVDTKRVGRDLPLLSEVLEGVMVDFYDHLRGTSAAVHLADAEISTLREAQRRHWLALFGDGIDEDYVRRIARVGLAHRLRDIGPETYMKAYGWLAARLVAEIVRLGPARNTASRTDELVSSVLKLVFLDMTMAVRAYDVALLD